MTMLHLITFTISLYARFVSTRRLREECACIRLRKLVLVRRPGNVARVVLANALLDALGGEVTRRKAAP
jgi:hypothetical protein